MSPTQNLEMLKKLEALTVLQEKSLNEDEWEQYDKIEEAIKKLENKIINQESRP